jgi:hypothetical protein
VSQQPGTAYPPYQPPPPKRPRRRGRLIALTAVGLGGVLALALAVAPSAGRHLTGGGHLADGGHLPGGGQPTSTPADTTTGSPTPTVPSVPSPTPSGPVVGGWYAGASGLGVTSGKFQRWLGQPVTVAATWADQDDAAQRTLPALRTEYKNWTGALDIAVGGTVLGSREDYAAAARGAYDKRWRTAAKTLADRRKNATGPTFVRPFHEMNGDWYDNWTVTKANSDDFAKAFARYVGILRAAMPGVYVSWSPNWTDHTKLGVEYWYPGDDVVDCVAPDYYDDGDGPARVSVSAWNAEADDTDSRGNPVGLDAWRQFALAHGKPLCFPEWGLKPEGDGVDHPFWIQAVNAWMTRNANTATWTLGQPIPAEAAGKVLYCVYFNVVHRGHAGFTIHGTTANPKSSAVYRKLRWGTSPGR